MDTLKSIVVTISLMFCGLVLLAILESEFSYSEIDSRLIMYSAHYILGCLTYSLTAWIMKK